MTAAAVSPSAASSIALHNGDHTQPLLVHHSPTATLGAPPDDPSGLAPGILRNMLKIPMDGKQENKEAISNNVSKNGVTHTASSAGSNSSGLSLPAAVTPPAAVCHPAVTPPRSKSRSPEQRTEKLWSPHDGMVNRYPHVDKNLDKKAEINGHFEHKSYMSQALTPPALKPIKKDVEKSPKKENHLNGDSERREKKELFRMPDSESQPKVYAPVTWPPIAPEAPLPKKDEPIRRTPVTTSAEKTKTTDVPSKPSSASSHKSSSEIKSGHTSSSSSKMASSPAVTSSPSTTLSQEAMTAQYHDYLRQPGLYPSLAPPR